MSRRVIVLSFVLLAAVVGGVAAIAIAGDGEAPAVNGPTNPDLASKGVVWHGKDMGKDEKLLLVIGGSFETEEQAQAANAEIGFGDVQGYYMAPTDQFAGLRSFLGPAADEYVLVTAFRTAEGARQFLELAAAADAPAMLTPRLTNRGGVYVGLGQEAHPDGTGPLIGPLPGVST